MQSIVNDRPVEIPGKEFEMLKLLAGFPGKVFSKGGNYQIMISTYNGVSYLMRGEQAFRIAGIFAAIPVLSIVACNIFQECSRQRPVVTSRTTGPLREYVARCESL